jgi:hypothetical protein
MAYPEMADRLSTFLRRQTMYGPFLHSRYMPCPECGTSVDRTAGAAHACDPERRLDFQLFGLREEVASLEAGIRAYFASKRGRFELWYAARERGRGRR